MARHALWPLLIPTSLSIRFSTCRQCEVSRKLLLEGGCGCTWLACTESKAEATDYWATVALNGGCCQPLCFVPHFPASASLGLDSCAVCVLHFHIFAFSPHALQATCLCDLRLGAGIAQGHAQRLALVCLMHLSVYKVP